MAPQKILIVGNGIAGPILASFLLLSPIPAAERPHITILERSRVPRGEGQNIDIRGSGLAILRKLGLEATIRANVTHEAGAAWVDAAGREWAAFGADRSGRVETGTADLEILRGRFASICYDRCVALSAQNEQEGGKGVEFVFGDALAALTQDEQHVSVRLAKSGATRSFDLVVGADGLLSTTRQLAFGPDSPDRLKKLGMYGAFFSMPAAPSDSLWRRWMHTTGRRGAMIRPSDRAGRSTAFMSIINDADPRIDALAGEGHAGVPAQKALIREFFEHAGWECERLCNEMDATNDFYYSAIAQVHMPAWSEGRVVLLGDAGYCASPLSGMGTTLAINGAYNLAGALLQHQQQHGAAFAAYEAKMRPLVARAQKLFPGMPHAFHPETAFGVWLLHAFMAALHWSGLITLLFMVAGPPASVASVEEFGFPVLPEEKPSGDATTEKA